MTVKILEQWIAEMPANVCDSYIFVVDNMDIAMSIIGVRMRCVCINSKEIGGSPTTEGLADFFQAMTEKGTCMMYYHFVLACLSKKANDMLKEAIKRTGYHFREGWHIFRDKEYLAKYENEEKLEKILTDYIRRFEGQDTRDLVDKSRFLRFNDNGEATGVYDAEIVDYMVEAIPFFVIDGQAYIYEHGVYRMDADGISLMDIIQGLIPKKFRKNNTIKQVYNLLVIQKQVQRTTEELNAYPRHWINFRNCMFDVINMKKHRHKPEYLSVNQLPHDLDVGARKDLEAAGARTIAYLDEAIPDKTDQAMLMQYIGYCMTPDSRFQRFMFIKGDGGTGKSVIISMVQNLIGKENYSTISLEDINQRFYPSELMGKLLNACADISSAPLNSVDIIKKVTGEDTLIYERKGRDPKTFRSYAKLLFSANKIPLNLDEKTDAFYRRLLILEMNIKPRVVDPGLKDKLLEEVQYLIWVALWYLKELYQTGEFMESGNSKRLVEDLYREADSVKTFLDECTEKDSPTEKIKRNLIYEEYQKYCEEYGRRSHSANSFYKALEERGYHNKRLNNGWHLYGIRMKEEGFMELDEEGQQELPFK